jgi:cysteine desulfurase
LEAYQEVIYLDYQATTPLAPEARAAMLPWLDGGANPHAAHKLGRAAKAAVEVARDQVGALMPPDGQVYFTSGATEALNWVIRSSAKGCKIVALATEHAAVLDTVSALSYRHDITILPVQPNGLVDLDAARAAITSDTALVIAMLVNNEIGVIQPVDDLAEMAHAVSASFLCDAVQGYGRVPLPTKANYIAVSAHKLHGPIGVGALWVRAGAPLTPFIHGGGQERGLRSGTLSPMLCAGFGAATQLMAARHDADAAHVLALAAQFRAALGADWIVNGATDQRYPGNLNVRREGLDAARLISDVREVAFSAGSACASGSGRPSHVLRALGLTDPQARASIRLGFGRYTTPDDIDRAAALITAAADQQRSHA